MNWLFYLRHRWWTHSDLWRLQRDLDQDRSERRRAAIMHADFQADHMAYKLNLGRRQHMKLRGMLRAFWLEGVNEP